VAWVQRWRRFATQEPATVRVRFSLLLVAGRWAAEKHPEAIEPDRWSRDMAAEYVADTMSATVGQWAGHSTTAPAGASRSAPKAWPTGSTRCAGSSAT
jgi:hypothetical protein